MKKVIAVFTLLASTPVAAGTIVGSEHDFSTQGWTNQICIVCHTPHNADTSVVAAPLWNHEVTNSTFILYNSPTLEGTVNQPSGTSKLCLSCHDGTVAVDNFGGTTSGTNFIDGPANFGVDLSNDHPISITYENVLDTGLADPATLVTIGSAGSSRTGSLTQLLIPAGTVECASCHDVHNTFTAAGNLLKISNDSSSLCLTCHTK